MPAKSRFTRLDAFTKTVEDARVRTTSGGIVTIVSLLVVFYLVWGEWSDYRRIVVHPELIVDKGRGMAVVENVRACSYVLIGAWTRGENGDTSERLVPPDTVRTVDAGCHGCIRRATNGSHARRQQSQTRAPE